MRHWFWQAGLLTMAIILAWPGSARAQYIQPPPPGAPVAAVPVVPPGYGYYPYGGGYWNGQAAMLDAYANVGLSQEQARIMREQANQAKLDTKMKISDVMAYERANKYWFSDEKADIQAKRVQAAMNNPPVQEVTSGRALNTLLPFIDSTIAMGKMGPTVPVDASIVRSMNVTSGGTSGNAGLLREINNLSWPASLLGPEQVKLDGMLKQATAEAMQGKVPSAWLGKIRKQLDVLDDQTRNRCFKTQEIDTAGYFDAKHFLDRVRDATKALQQPNVAQIVTGQLGPRGDTVDQVVESMASKGLTFVAAQPGQEGDYVAMHRAFVNYARGTGVSDTGFRVRLAGGAGGVPAQK